MKDGHKSDRVEPVIFRQPPPAEGLRSGCPMATMLEMLTRPWTLHILWVLSTQGPMRFGAMRRAVEGISSRLLTLRLRTLEDEGLVRRTVLGGKQPAVVYTPTERLKDMDELMEQLHRVGAKWRAEDAPRGDAETVDGPGAGELIPITSARFR